MTVLRDQIVRHVSVRMQADRASEQALRKLAAAEHRKGWSSTVLANLLCNLVANSLDKLVVRPRAWTAQLLLDAQAVRAIVGELEHWRTNLQNASEHEIQRGKNLALLIAITLGLDEQTRRAEQGADIRWAVMRSIADTIGVEADLGAGLSVPASHFETRPSPDDNALAAARRLVAAEHEMRDALSGELAAGLPVNFLTHLGVCRVHPKGGQWTAVGVRVQLPGTQALNVLWHVDSHRPKLDVDE